MVIVGADRVAANGDVANKIGTYSLAVLCKEHKLPFYVAAPLSTIDFSLADGSAIPVELRPARDLTAYLADVPIRAGDALVPAADVVPAASVDTLITEAGASAGASG